MKKIKSIPLYTRVKKVKNGYNLFLQTIDGLDSKPISNTPLKNVNEIISFAAKNKLIVDNLEKSLESYIRKIVSEVMDVTGDPELEEKVKQYAELSDKMAKLEAELEELKSKFTPLDIEFRNTLEKLAEQTGDAKSVFIKAKTLLIKISTKGYDRKSIKYKEAFDWLYTRVNPQMKKIVDESIAANSTVSYIKSKLAVQTTKESKLTEISFNSIYKKIKEKAVTKTNNCIKVVLKSSLKKALAVLILEITKYPLKTKTARKCDQCNSKLLFIDFADQNLFIFDMLNNNKFLYLPRKTFQFCFSCNTYTFLLDARRQVCDFDIRLPCHLE